MSEFKIHNAEEEDLSRFPEFFSQSFAFNAFNKPPTPQNFDHNFLSRMTTRTVEKMIFARSKPVFYISYKRAAVVNTIETMVLEPAFETDRAGLYEFIRSECFHKASMLGHSQFDYVTCDEPFNNEVMVGLGFKRLRHYRTMDLMLDYQVRTLANGELKTQTRVEPVKGIADMADRVKIQNTVFENRTRIPLELPDVQTEMKNSSYIPELALMLSWNEIPCAYGQIIRNASSYYLVNFGVLPQFQGHGLAHILLDELLERARQLKIEQIMLEVYQDNKKAIGLYEKHGFKTMYDKSHWLYKEK